MAPVRAVALLWAAAFASPRTGTEVEVTMARSGIKPAEITVRKGEVAHLRVRSLDREHCFAVDAFRVEKRVLPSKPTSFDLVPDRAGAFPIHSCLEPDNSALRARLVVTE
jgi:heme/copper-type cytochrome/quinol oxidase subunit 2